MYLFKNVVLIVAAGSGERMNNLLPKQYMTICGESILRRTVNNFLSHEEVNGIKVVIAPGHEELYAKSTQGLDLLPFSYGGRTRQQSVFKGLTDLKELNPLNVLIHDAVRPFISAKEIGEVIELLEKFEAVDLGIPVQDTLKFRDRLNNKIERDSVYATQTPQGFRYEKILRLHNKYENQDDFTDDIAIAAKENIVIAIASGNRLNYKITTEEDLFLGKALLLSDYETRTGFGYDVHKIEISEELPNSIPIAGINISSEYKVIAHSDGDVAIHAIIDAMLGAISAGDIGHHFPPNDINFKNIDSKILLQKVSELLKKRNAIIVNIDCTLVAETPKIKEYIEKMKSVLASILDLRLNQVSIKATTSEKLGFIGDKKGIAAYAVCNVKVKHMDKIRDYEI
jgi:2-C-methyl-D-erythritol 4-phosphate cytidylyltransferase / 2-C-methyl-D-erythritol 2,4-cyclodiphosphate synthase